MVIFIYFYRMNIIKKWGGKGSDKPNKPNKIVWHAMSEFIGGVHSSDFLTKLGLSAHYLITPSGEIIETYDPSKVAWHCRGHNTDSIGIEVLVEGNSTSYDAFLSDIHSDGWVSDTQLKSCVYLGQKLMDDHIIDISENYKHSTLDPSRKEDPGKGFPWMDLLGSLIDCDD